MYAFVSLHFGAIRRHACTVLSLLHNYNDCFEGWYAQCMCELYSLFRVYVVCIKILPKWTLCGTVRATAGVAVSDSVSPPQGGAAGTGVTQGGSHDGYQPWGSVTRFYRHLSVKHQRKFYMIVSWDVACQRLDVLMFNFEIKPQRMNNLGVGVENIVC